MMTQAAIRWAESWRCDQVQTRLTVHVDVCVATNRPYNYEQFLTFIQHASKDFDVALIRTNHDAFKSECNQIMMQQTLKDAVDWSACCLLKAEMSGIIQALEVSTVPDQRQKSRILVLPSFAACTLLEIGQAERQLMKDSFDEIHRATELLNASTFKTELLVQRDCGLEDSILACTMADSMAKIKCQEFGSGSVLCPEKSARRDLQRRRLVGMVSLKWLKNMITLRGRSSNRSSYKFICRCVARTNQRNPAEDMDHCFTGAHRHQVACLSCTTSAFVRYRAVACLMFDVQPFKPRTDFAGKTTTTMRMTALLGNNDHVMCEQFRLYTKEDVRCLLLLMGMFNPSNLHPILLAHDVDVWWSICIHYGSVTGGLRQIFVKEIADALVLVQS